jgi:hypothetical protein
LAIAFDTTGYFALSNATTQGIGLYNRKLNSIIVRDTNNNVVVNETLTNLDPNFVLTTNSKDFKTIRVRLSNAGRKLYVDWKSGENSYANLVDIPLSGFNPDINTIVYPGLTFCSPMSSSSAIPSTLFLKNFHVEGLSADPTIEYIPMVSILSDSLTYTTISAISAL